MEQLTNICFGLSILCIIFANWDQYEKIDKLNENIKDQQNLEESNNLVKELNK